MPGKYFYAKNDQGRATMRLNYTTAELEDISRAVGIIGQAIEAELDS